MICEVIIVSPAWAVFRTVYLTRRAGKPTGWTLDNAIQQHIDIYVSQATFREVQRAFPYLVAREFASGGGDVRSPKCEFVRCTDICDG